MSYGTQVEDHRQRGDELFAQGDYMSAASEYQKLVDAMPASAPALKALGVAKLRCGNLDESIQYLGKAAVLLPGDADIRYSYGYGLGSAERYSEAADELDAALSLQPHHGAAKDALVFSLSTHAERLMKQDQFQEAERFMDRAHKIDPRNPVVSGALLNLLYVSGQKGKAIKLMQSMDEGMRGHAAVKPTIEKMNSDPAYQVSLKQASYSAPAPSTTTARPEDANALKKVPCPQCKLPVMDFAAVCPHCNFQIRAIGRFADIDRGPNVVWQEVCYTIFSVIWCLLSGWDLYASLMMKEEFIKPVFITVASVNLAIGLGLAFRMEWVAFIAKLFLYLTVIRALYGILLATALTGSAMWLTLGLSVLQLGIAGFMIYLINYVVGD